MKTIINMITRPFKPGPNIVNIEITRRSLIIARFSLLFIPIIGIFMGGPVGIIPLSFPILYCLPGYDWFEPNSSHFRRWLSGMIRIIIVFIPMTFLFGILVAIFGDSLSIINYSVSELLTLFPR